jgi:hypothetical protein
MYSISPVKGYNKHARTWWNIQVLSLSWDLGKDKAVDMTDGMIVALAISSIIFES